MSPNSKPIRAARMPRTILIAFMALLAGLIATGRAKPAGAGLGVFIIWSLYLELSTENFEICT